MLGPGRDRRRERAPFSFARTRAHARRRPSRDYPTPFAMVTSLERGRRVVTAPDQMDGRRDVGAAWVPQLAEVTDERETLCPDAPPVHRLASRREVVALSAPLLLQRLLLSPRSTGAGLDTPTARADGGDHASGFPACIRPHRSQCPLQVALEPPVERLLSAIVTTALYRRRISLSMKFKRRVGAFWAPSPSRDRHGGGPDRSTRPKSCSRPSVDYWSGGMFWLRRRTLSGS